MESTINFFKTFVATLQTRDKQIVALQNEAMQLREKTNSLQIQMQDLVHPRKWNLEAEQQLFLENVNAYMNNGINPTIFGYDEKNSNDLFHVDMNLLEATLDRADKFLREHKGSSM